MASFRAEVLGYFARSGRSFPWRSTLDPWAILVSEIMLQQTQTERVVPKYLAWLEAYPNPVALAAAPLADIGILTAMASFPGLVIAHILSNFIGKKLLCRGRTYEKLSCTSR